MKFSWNDKNINFLKNNYEYMTSNDLATVLGTTRSSVDNKLNQLNLKRTPFWNEERTNYLLANYKKKSLIDIAEKLGTTEML